MVIAADVIEHEVVPGSGHSEVYRTLKSVLGARGGALGDVIIGVCTNGIAAIRDTLTEGHEVVVVGVPIWGDVVLLWRSASPLGIVGRGVAGRQEGALEGTGGSCNQ